MNGSFSIGVRLDAGAELPEAAVQAARRAGISFCDVSGFGEIEWIEIGGPAQGETARLEGPFSLVDLKGRIRLAGGTALSDFVCTVSSFAGSGSRIWSGRLLRAEVRFAEIALSPLAVPRDLSAEMPASPVAKPAKEPAEGHPVLDGPAQPAGRLQQAADTRWARAIQESKQAESLDDAEDEKEGGSRPTRGDIVRHQQFGACQVTRVSDDHITLRKPDGRQIELGMTVLRFTREGEEGKRAVFGVEVRPPKR